MVVMLYNIVNVLPLNCTPALESCEANMWKEVITPKNQ